jgi:curved DNA-binding protein CbpA
MAGKTHYQILDVPNDAKTDEIRKSYLEKSLKYHPDLNKEHSCGEKFKFISNAHSVLSCTLERHKYDRQLLEDTMWRKGMDHHQRGGSGSRGGNFYGNGNLNNHRRPKPGLHVAMETLSNPRYMLYGIIGFGSVALLGSMMGGISSKRPEYHHQEALVEAWKNPATGRYEQPAPWDKNYQRIQPKLEMVPRGKVWKRQM